MTSFNLTLSFLLGLTLTSFATTYTYTLDFSAGYSQEAIVAGIQNACGGECSESDEIIVSIEGAKLTFASAESTWDLTQFNNLRINISDDASLVIPENAQLLLSEGSILNDKHANHDGIFSKSTTVPFLKIGKTTYTDIYAQRVD